MQILLKAFSHKNHNKEEWEMTKNKLFPRMWFDDGLILHQLVSLWLHPTSKRLTTPLSGAFRFFSWKAFSEQLRES